MVDSDGVRRIDNLLKPDLVAPGNRSSRAAATTAVCAISAWNAPPASYYGVLVTPLGDHPVYGETQMLLSGTSISAPAVAGTAALMLQANPGLTPPLIKAILQFTAQPLPNANVLQQGAGLLNVDGAIPLAKTLKPRPRRGRSPPATTAGAAHERDRPAGVRVPTVDGRSFNWSRVVFVGGNHVVSGNALFIKHQAIGDPRLTWAGDVIRKRQPDYWSDSGIAVQHLRAVVH